MGESNTTAIGLLADTHSMKDDGSDLPDAVLEAFTDARVDVIVHLGDIGRKGILERLAGVAPIFVPVGANKGYVPHGSAGDARKVMSAGAIEVGLWFNLAQPDKKIVVRDDDIEFTVDPFEKLMHRRFKQAVRAVAFGGTHRPMSIERHGVLFVNPGSPTLPVPGASASVAVLTIDGDTPSARIVEVGGSR